MAPGYRDLPIGLSLEDEWCHPGPSSTRIAWGMSVRRSPQGCRILQRARDRGTAELAPARSAGLRRTIRRALPHGSSARSPARAVDGAPSARGRGRRPAARPGGRRDPGGRRGPPASGLRAGRVLDRSRLRWQSRRRPRPRACVRLRHACRPAIRGRTDLMRDTAQPERDVRLPRARERGRETPRPAAATTGPPRVVIESVTPEIGGGRFPAKRVVGEVVTVEADVFAEGHDRLAALLRVRRSGDATWQEIPMEARENDRWEAAFTVSELGTYEYTVHAWVG